MTFAQDTPSPHAVPSGAYENADDTIPFSEAQNSQAARIFVTEQEKVLNDVFTLAEKLEEKKQILLFELGDKRVQELKEASKLPEGNIFDRGRKQQKLLKLGAQEFSNLDWESVTGKITIGENVYEQRTIKGERIEEFRIEIPGIGKAEPTSIDKTIITRVVHEESGVAFLLLSDVITFDSKHLQQYIARVRYFSNRGKGRPVVLLSYQHSTTTDATSSAPLKYKFFDTPNTWKEKFRTWLDATYVSPNKGAVALTAMSVIFQVATTEGISAAKFALGSTPVWDHTASYLTAAFGTVFGLWGSFYYNITASKNPTDPSSRRAALLKRIFISSASFAYCLQIMNHGVESVSLMTVGGWLTNLGLWGNIIANNAIKDPCKLFSDIREGMGLNRGTVVVLGAEIKKNQLERNLVDQVSRTMKMLDLMKFSICQVPIGSFLFYSSYVWSQYLVMKYAEKVNYEYKAKLQAQWKKMIQLPFKPAQAIDETSSELGYRLIVAGPTKILRMTWNSVKETIQKAYETCNSYLKDKSSEEESLLPSDARAEKDIPFSLSADGEWLIAKPAQ